MLKRISIQNYLLIDALELSLGSGLTTITGETGSGKSILIGALALAMGERAETGFARDATKRCVIEIEIDTGLAVVEDWCRESHVPADTPMILRRQLDPGGRSRSFVNDTPVRLDQLRDLGERLIHVHSQHHTLLLNDPAFQLGLIDHFVGHTKDVRIYTERYAGWRRKRTELDALREEEARAQSESDYLRFQLEELDSAKLIIDELPALELSLAKADHAEEISSTLFSVQDGIAGDEGVRMPLHALRQLLSKTAKIDADTGALGERINSVLIELQDIADEAERLGALVNADPKAAERMRGRLDLLLRLQQKHRVNDLGGLITLRDDLRIRTNRIGSLNQSIAEVQEKERIMFKQVQEHAHSISSKRFVSLVPVADQVAQLLKNLGMPHAVFHFEHAETEPTATGIDKVGARFSANKDRVPAPLEKVASGGELSRVMLALISLGAKSRSLPTVIFDEIDTGISGETAYRVGGLMAQMAKDRQVIAITHLPQIASKADTHLLVSKDQDAQNVTSSIRPLAHEERVQALAQMISGKKTTKAAVENARELLKGK